MMLLATDFIVSLLLHELNCRAVLVHWCLLVGWCASRKTLCFYIL